MELPICIGEGCSNKVKHKSRKFCSRKCASNAKRKKPNKCIICGEIIKSKKSTYCMVCLKKGYINVIKKKIFTIDVIKMNIKDGMKFCNKHNRFYSGTICKDCIKDNQKKSNAKQCNCGAWFNGSPCRSRCPNCISKDMKQKSMRRWKKQSLQILQKDKRHINGRNYRR